MDSPHFATLIGWNDTTTLPYGFGRTQPVLERPLGLLHRHRPRKYDLYGLGVLCRNYWKRRTLLRTQSRTCCRRISHSGHRNGVANGSLPKRNRSKRLTQPISFLVASTQAEFLPTQVASLENTSAKSLSPLFRSPRIISVVTS